MFSKTDLNITQKIKPKRNLKQRFTTFGGRFGRNADLFCKNTTLHGLRYLTDKELHLRERIFFGLAFITVVLLAGFFVLSVLEKWNTTPIIFGTNPQQTFVIKEPFPAVTICNLNVAYKSKAEKFSIFSTEYAMLQLLCKRDVNVTIIDSIKDWSSLIPFLTDIAQPCSQMILNCKFGSVKYNCSKIFKPLITDEGFCCTFNMVHPAFIYNSQKGTLTKHTNNPTEHTPVPWTAENGYPQDLPNKFYPHQTPGVGETLGLSLILDVASDEYYCSSMNSVGFKILAHSPMEIPSMKEIGLLLSPGRETKIRIRPEKYESDKKLRKIHRRYRQCLFEDEESLVIFSHYNQRNCEVECVAKLLLKYCGCIPHYLPRLHGNESICSIYQSNCVERMQIASKLSEYNATRCSEWCLPSCFEGNYFLDFFEAPVKHFGFQIASQIIKNMSSNDVKENVAVIHMYFREYSYRTLKQTEFFGFTDVLSSIGGLLGIFFGFSFISIVELIFYAGIRPFQKARQTEVALENVETNTNVEVKKKPLNQRFKNEIEFGGFKASKGQLNIKKMFITEEFLRQKAKNDDEILNNWYNRRQFAV